MFLLWAFFSVQLFLKRWNKFCQLNFGPSGPLTHLPWSTWIQGILWGPFWSRTVLSAQLSPSPRWSLQGFNFTAVCDQRRVLPPHYPLRINSTQRVFKVNGESVAFGYLLVHRGFRWSGRDFIFWYLCAAVGMPLYQKKIITVWGEGSRLTCFHQPYHQ